MSSVITLFSSPFIKFAPIFNPATLWRGSLSYNMKRSAISILPPSSLDDLCCRDGEITNPLWVFSGQEIKDDAPSRKPSSGSDEPDLSLPPFPALGLPALSAAHKFRIPDGFRIIAFHNPGNGRDLRPLVISPDALPGVMFDDSHVSMIPDADPLLYDSVAVTGNFISCITREGVRFFRYRPDSDSYEWLGDTPSHPSVSFSLEPSAFPPYSAVADSPPLFDVAVGVADDLSAATLDWLAGHDSRRCPDSVKGAVCTAVASAFSTLLDKIERAGYIFGSLSAAAARVTSSGNLTLLSPLLPLGFQAPVALQIVSASHNSGILAMRLRLNRSPSRLKAVVPAAEMPSAWRAAFPKVALLSTEYRSDIARPVSVSDAASVAQGARGFFVTMTAADPAGADDAPPALYSLATLSVGSDDYARGCLLPSPATMLSPVEITDLLAVRNPRILRSCSGVLLSVGDSLGVSLPGLPMVCSALCEVAGEILDVAPSLKALSSGQLGDFPLYAFTSEGIHALSPDGKGGMRDVQLIARDLPMSHLSIEPLPAATAFISPQGVMSVAASKVSLLSDELDSQTDPWIFTPSDRLAYHYPSDSLILYNPDASSCRVLDMQNSTWHSASLKIRMHLNAWPRLFSVDEDGFCREVVRIGSDDPSLPLLYPEWNPPAESTEKSDTGTATGNPPSAIPTVPDSPMISGDSFIVYTRPIKLGDPFACKRLSAISLLWPDLCRRPFRLEGRNPGGPWRVIARSDGQPLRLRGSAFRLYRLVLSFPLPAEENRNDRFANIRPLLLFSHTT